MISNFIHCTMHAMCFVQTMSTYISAMTSELLLSMPCIRLATVSQVWWPGRGAMVLSSTFYYLGGHVLISLTGSSAIHFLSMHFAHMLEYILHWCTSPRWWFPWLIHGRFFQSSPCWYLICRLSSVSRLFDHTLSSCLIKCMVMIHLLNNTFSPQVYI